MLHVRLLHIVIILALCGAVLGCEQPQAAVDLGPQLDVCDQRRSLVLDDPMLSFMKSQDDQPAGYAWYHDRNDRRVGALAGYESPIIESSTTRTRDYQFSTHGRSYDHFQSTTYRTEYRRGTR